MVSKIALFPLQLVVFPGEDLNLHIFEPRYRQLIADAREHGISFGIPAFIEDRIMPIGTEVKLVEVAKQYPTGESDVRTVAVGLFRLQEFYPQLNDRLYAGGQIERIDSSVQEDTAANYQIRQLAQELFAALGVQKDIPELNAGFSTYAIAHHIGLTLEQEYELLCAFDASSRQAMILEHLQRVLPIVRESEAIKTKASLNGHFKNVIPPQL